MFRDERHFHCSEQVLIKINAENLIPNFIKEHLKIASGFGGGVSDTGYICGAIIGGVIALGIKYGTDGTEDLRVFSEKREKLERMVQRLVKSFESKFGAVNCQGLLGFRLCAEEGKRKYRELKAAGKLRCHDYIDFCSKFTCRLLEE